MCPCHLGHRVAQADSHAQLRGLSPQRARITSVMCVSRLLDKQPRPRSEQREVLHLWVGVPADDKANGSRGALAQDGVDFAQGGVAHVDRVHLQDLISAAGGSTIDTVHQSASYKTAFREGLQQGSFSQYFKEVFQLRICAKEQHIHRNTSDFRLAKALCLSTRIK